LAEGLNGVNRQASNERSFNRQASKKLTVKADLLSFRAHLAAKSAYHKNIIPSINHHPINKLSVKRQRNV